MSHYCPHGDKDGKCLVTGCAHHFAATVTCSRCQRGDDCGYRDPRDKLDLDDVVHGHPVAEKELQALRDQIIELRAAIQGVLSWHEYEIDPENYEKEHDGWKPLLPWRRLHSALKAGE